MWHKPYGIGRAAMYALMLYVCLWWLPLFGPMVAGYVVGRKAGSPWKGVAASLAPLLAYLLLRQLVMAGVIIPPSTTYSPYSSFIAGTITPPLTTFFISTKDHFVFYLENFTAFVRDAPSSFVILSVFAYVGGAMSEIRRMEIGYMRLAAFRASVKNRVDKVARPRERVPVRTQERPQHAGKVAVRPTVARPVPVAPRHRPRPLSAVARPTPHPEVYRQDIRKLGKKRMPPLVKKALRDKRRHRWERL